MPPWSWRSSPDGTDRYDCRPTRRPVQRAQGERETERSGDGDREPRLTCLRAALAFLQLRGNAPELVLLYRWLDLWVGIGGHEGHEGIRAAGTARRRRRPGARCSGRRGRRSPSEVLVALLPPLELPGGIASEVKVIRLHPGVAVELDLNKVFDGEGQIADRAFGANLWSTRRAVGTSVGNLSGLECRPNLLAERLVTCSFVALSATRRATAFV